MEDYILKVEELNYNYSDGTHALKGIDMNIKRGVLIPNIFPNKSVKK